MIRRISRWHRLLDSRGLWLQAADAAGCISCAIPLYEHCPWCRSGLWNLEGGKRIHLDFLPVFEDNDHTDSIGTRLYQGNHCSVIHPFVHLLAVDWQYHISWESSSIQKKGYVTGRRFTNRKLSYFKFPVEPFDGIDLSCSVQIDC